MLTRHSIYPHTQLLSEDTAQSWGCWLFHARVDPGFSGGTHRPWVAGWHSDHSRVNAHCYLFSPAPRWPSTTCGHPLAVGTDCAGQAWAVSEGAWWSLGAVRSSRDHKEGRSEWPGAPRGQLLPETQLLCHWWSALGRVSLRTAPRAFPLHVTARSQRFLPPFSLTQGHHVSPRGFAHSAEHLHFLQPQ